MFPGLTRLGAWRENGKGVRKVSDVSGVALFGGTEGVRLRVRARLGEFPKPYARIEFISPECCVKMGEKLIPVGIDGMKEHIQATKQTYPDYRMKITKQFCDGDYVISEFIMEGTHKGEWIGIKPTGKRLVFTGINIDKITDGLIVEHGGAVKYI